MVMSNKNTTQDSLSKQEFTLEITQEKYDEMKARGIDEEAIPSVGKHTFRRRNRTIDPRDAKIKLTFYIEGDILKHFRQNAGGDQTVFETLLNKALRSYMENEIAEEEKNLEEVADKLVNNAKFIDAISEKLKAA